MFQKDVIHACFRLFFVVLVVAALAQSSCYDDISGILNGPEGRHLLGGWRDVDKKNQEVDRVVKGIVASGLKQYNLQSNDLHSFELFEDGNYEAYQQLVNGLNYCVRFTVVSNGCKNSLNGDYCRNGKKMTCSVLAYQAFGDADARINPEKLVCKKSA